MRCYQLDGYFVTTEDQLSEYLAVFELTEEQTELIERGASLSVVGGYLLLEPMLTFDDPPSLDVIEPVDPEPYHETYED